MLTLKEAVEQNKLDQFIAEHGGETGDSGGIAPRRLASRDAVAYSGRMTPERAEIIRWLRELARTASSPQAAGAYAYAADELERRAVDGRGRLLGRGICAK